MSKSTFGVAVAVFAIVTGLFAGCGSSDDDSSSASSTAPIKIGFLAGTSGFAAPLAKADVLGARLAVERINSQGGVLGRPLELIVRDDASDPAVGVRQARDLAQSEKVKFLAGTETSAVAAAVRKTIVDPLKIFYAAPVADPSVFENAHAEKSNIFGMVYTVVQEGEGVSRYVKAHPEFKTAAFVGEDYSYGHEVGEAFKQGLEKYAPDVELLSTDFATPGASTYAPLVAKLQRSKPDFIFNNLFGADLITFTKNAQQVGLLDDTKMIADWEYSTLLATDPSDIPFGQPAYSVYPEPDFFDNPLVTEVKREYVASTGEKVFPGAAASNFNGITLIAEGIKKAGSDDPAKVAQALEGAQIDFTFGEATVRKCDHLIPQPMIFGTLAKPTKDTPYQHIEGETVDVSTTYGPDSC